MEIEMKAWRWDRSMEGRMEEGMNVRREGNMKGGMEAWMG